MKKILYMFIAIIAGCASSSWGHSTLILEDNNSNGDKWYLSTCSNLDSCFRDMELTCYNGKISYRSPQQENGVYHVMYECITAPRPDKPKGVIDGLIGH